MPRCSQCFVLLEDLLLDTLDENPISVPTDAQEILYEMTLKYLLDEPDDTLKFCYNYMMQLKESRHTQIEIAEMDPMYVLGESYWNRRQAFYDDSFTEQIQSESSAKSADQNDFIIRSITDLLPFKYLSPNVLKAILSYIYPLEVKSGQSIAVQGEPSLSFYLIASGLYSAYLAEGDYVKAVQTYENEGCFGDLALLYENESKVTVVSHSPGLLWALDRETYRLIVWTSEMAKRSSYSSLLDKVRVLSCLTLDERSSLVDCMVSREFSDDIVIMEGEYPQKVYFIEKGIVQFLVTDPVSGKEQKLKELKQGEHFNHRALVDKTPWNCDVRVVGDTTIVILLVNDFNCLLGTCLSVMRRYDCEEREELLEELTQA